MTLLMDSTVSGQSDRDRLAFRPVNPASVVRFVQPLKASVALVTLLKSNGPLFLVNEMIVEFVNIPSISVTLLIS